MVLLRMAIGWHLCYEGLTKIDPGFYDMGKQRLTESKAWSAEGYLRNANSPFEKFFKGIVDDIDGYGRYDVPTMTAKWKRTAGLAATHFNFTESQKQAVDRKIAELKGKLETHIGAEANKKKFEDYKKTRDAFLASAKQKNWDVDPRDRQVRQKDWADIEKSRMEICGPVDQWTKDLEAEIALQLNDDQRKLPEVLPAWKEMTELERVNTTTKYGLALCGGLMFAGLFSRLASLGAACFLGLFYFSQVPPPFYPPAPVAEGTYYVVNKNLIEMIACLMLATSPSGAWGGLDALIRGFITRPLFGFGAREVRERHGVE